MDNLAIGFRKPCGRLLLATMAVALLSLTSARAADEFIDDDFFVPDQCANCNLYWHGGEGCVTSRLPRWYAGADVMVLRRDMDEEVTFATFTNTTDIALGTSSFKDEFDAGIRFFAGYAINDWYRIEGLYYGSYHFNGDMAVDDTLGLPPPSFDFPFDDMGDRARIRFSSSLDNVELNLRSRLSDHPGPLQVSLLFGGRYVKLDERFTYDSNGTIRNVDVGTSNDLLGLQIGLMAQLQCGHWTWLDYELKGAIYTNRASQRTSYLVATEDDSDAAALNIRPGAGYADSDVTAFSVDMSLIFNYQITPSLSLRFGYNAMWLGGVALGAQNVQTDVNLLTMGPAKLDHAGLVVYHGPSFGVVLAR